VHVSGRRSVRELFDRLRLQTAVLSFPIYKMAVVVDALAFLRLYKTSVESHPDLTTGILVGAEEGETVVVSNATALPGDEVVSTQEGEQQVVEPVGDYQEEYMDSLAAINGDLNIVGCFFAGNVGSVLSDSNLRKVYELQSKKASSILLTFDLPAFKALRSSVRAFRLSEAMMTYFRSNGITTPGAADQALIELPVNLTVPVLVDAFLAENVAWVQANAKAPLRMSNYLERNLEILNRNLEESLGKMDEDKPVKKIEKFLQKETARLLRCEAVKAARALVEV